MFWFGLKKFCSQPRQSLANALQDARDNLPAIPARATGGDDSNKYPLLQLFYCLHIATLWIPFLGNLASECIDAHQFVYG